MMADTPFGHPGRVIKNESHSNGVEALMAITHAFYLSRLPLASSTSQ
ncbi:hypothetical protein FHW68_000829 [Pseudomonas sp. Tn43]|nr:MULTISPECIES: hypothetical protein [unclassified Pseudomonas]MBB3239357.1 hypothetical protein [Pseudomonas sp. Tn43]